MERNEEWMARGYYVYDDNGATVFYHASQAVVKMIVDEHNSLVRPRKAVEEFIRVSGWRKTDDPYKDALANLRKAAEE